MVSSLVRTCKCVQSLLWAANLQWEATWSFPKMTFCIEMNQICAGFTVLQYTSIGKSASSTLKKLTISTRLCYQWLIHRGYLRRGGAGGWATNKIVALNVAYGGAATPTPPPPPLWIRHWLFLHDVRSTILFNCQVVCEWCICRCGAE